MCGRFTLTLDSDEVREALKLGVMPAEWRPRFNISPSQQVAVVADAATRNVQWMRWGLVPSWAKDSAIGYNMINARAETVMEKPAYRQAFTRRRCLILADGFYEWLKPPAGQRSGSQPYHFTLADSKPFAFAGLWEVWKPADGEELTTCTIITCPANAVVAPVHDRMPVVLTGDTAWDWLEIDHAATLHAILKPYPAEGMQAVPVGRGINDSKNDGPDSIQAVDL